MHLQLIRWRSLIWLLNGTGIIFTPLALMKFEHRILIIQPVSYNLCFYRILPVSASPVFLPMQYLSRFPVYSCRSVGLLSSGSFSASLLAYKLHLNSTTVCFVYKRPMHWCGQVITIVADRSVSLWLAPPSQPALFVGNRDDRLMATSAFRNLARPTAKDLFCPSLRRSSILNEKRKSVCCADNGCHAC